MRRQLGWSGINGLPIRVRLTFFYLATLVALLVIFAAFVYLRVRRDLYAQIDSALELAAIQAVAVIDLDEPTLTFENIKLPPGVQQRLTDFAIALFAPQGQALDTIGVYGPTQLTAVAPGYHTVHWQDDRWRLHIEPVRTPTRQIVAWVQVAQSLDEVDSTLAGLQLQFLIGIPLALLLAGGSGLFLAVQALEPMNRITQTAQAIHEDDLTQRIHYRGPADEVGRLAATFDQMLDRLQAVVERQLRFTSDAAHELRVPLGALKARIDVMLSRPRQPEEYQAALQDIERQVNRLTQLVQALLFMARIDQERQPLAREAIAFNEFIAGIIDHLVPLAAAKAITLQQHSPQPITLVGNIDMLIRLFLNLLDNAIKYAPAGSVVAIHSSVTATTIRIAIQDNGPGISAEHLPYLFDRFYRVESSRARSPDEQSGSGLGLAIAYQIARLHGGALLVASEPGRGTTFTVELPASSSS